jgi:hypothetical protein
LSDVGKLTDGVAAWNNWRHKNRGVIPDLRGSTLSGMDLRNCLLDGALLHGADLRSSDLRGAVLSKSDLRGAQLADADLRGADLRSAVLSDLVGFDGNCVVDITDADFGEARLGWTIIGDIYLNRIRGIGGIVHLGPSYISTSSLEFTATELQSKRVLRTDVEVFLRGAGVLTDFLPDFERAVRCHQFQSAFISYSHSNKRFSHWLHRELESSGVRCWLDEKNIKPGERILSAVANAIGQHDRVLLCCSKDALESWWVQDEILKVHEIERRSKALKIIPVMLDDFMLSWDHELAADLRARAACDFRGWSETGEYRRQIKGLLSALKK